MIGCRRLVNREPNAVLTPTRLFPHLLSFYINHNSLQPASKAVVAGTISCSSASAANTTLKCSFFCELDQLICTKFLLCNCVFCPALQDAAFLAAPRRHPSWAVCSPSTTHSTWWTTRTSRHWCVFRPSLLAPLCHNPISRQSAVQCESGK